MQSFQRAIYMTRFIKRDLVHTYNSVTLKRLNLVCGVEICSCISLMIGNVLRKNSKLYSFLLQNWIRVQSHV